MLEIATENGVRDAALPRLDEMNVFDYQQLVFAPGMTKTVNLRVQVSDVPSGASGFGPTSAALSELEVWVK